MASARSIGSRVASILFVIVLFGVVAYFALKAIPSAQRPSLHAPPRLGSSHRH